MKTRLLRVTCLVVFLLVAGYAFITLRGPRGIPALIAKEHQIREAEKRNGDLAREIERQRERIERLDSNAAEQELEIRERLKLVHPDEKVFITGQPEKP